MLCVQYVQNTYTYRVYKVNHRKKFYLGYISNMYMKQSKKTIGNLRNVLILSPKYLISDMFSMDLYVYSRAAYSFTKSR